MESCYSNTTDLRRPIPRDMPGDRVGVSPERPCKNHRVASPGRDFPPACPTGWRGVGTRGAPKWPPEDTRAAVAPPPLSLGQGGGEKARLRRVGAPRRPSTTNPKKTATATIE